MTIHILVPYTTEAACGLKSPARNAAFRHQVDCPQCKKTELFSKMPIHRASSKATGMQGKRK